MGILDIIAQGGRQGKSLGDISLEKQSLTMRQEELSMARRTATAQLGKIAMDRETEMLKRNKDKLRKDIVSGSMQNAIGLGTPDAVGPLIMEAAAAAGDWELLKDVKEAYEATGKGTKPVSKVGKIQADLGNTVPGSPEAADLEAQLRSENAKAVTAQVKSEEVADSQAWEDLSGVFGFEKKYLGFGEEAKEPTGYFDMQERYKELLNEGGKKFAVEQIQKEFEIDSKLGSDEVIRIESIDTGKIDFDFTE